MKYLNNVYEETTNENNEYTRLFALDVIFSILFHSILYTLVIYGIQTNLFPQKKLLQPHFYKKLFVTFVIIMVIGYPLRLWRVKTLDDDDEKVIIYRNWYFLA